MAGILVFLSCGFVLMSFDLSWYVALVLSDVGVLLMDCLKFVVLWSCSFCLCGLFCLDGRCVVETGFWCWLIVIGFTLRDFVELLGCY